MRSPAAAYISATQRALVCCARVELEPSTRAQLLELARAGLDFDALVQQAAAHGLTPLVSRHVHQELAALCPPRVLSRLSQDTRDSVMRSLALAGELVAVIDLLREAGIPAVAIKGPIAATLCYGDFGLRTFSDLDVLIAPRDVPGAKQLLLARGYAPQFALTEVWHERLVRADSEELFRHVDGRRLIDIHWSLLPRGYTFTPGAGGLFAQRRTARVGMSDVPTLGPEATLVFLLLHGMKHDWSHLGWLTDVAELLRREPALRWDAVLAWGATPGSMRMLGVGLKLAHELLGAPVPEHIVSRAAADVSVTELAGVVAERLLTPQPSSAPTLVERSIGSLYFRAMQRRRDRLQFLHDVVLRPTPLEWRALPLPPALAPLHYLTRPIRLLWKHMV